MTRRLLRSRNTFLPRRVDGREASGVRGACSRRRTSWLIQSGSKLHALQTLRAVRLWLCRSGPIPDFQSAGHIGEHNSKDFCPVSASSGSIVMKKMPDAQQLLAEYVYAGS